MDDVWVNVIGGFLGGFAGSWLGGRLVLLTLYDRVAQLEQLMQLAAETWAHGVRRSP